MIDPKNSTLGHESLSVDAFPVEEAIEEVFLNDDEDENLSSEASYDSVASPAVPIADLHGSDLGVPQILDSRHEDEIKTLISEARIYIRDTIRVEEEYVMVRDQCVNKNELCAFWATLGGT